MDHTQESLMTSLRYTVAVAILVSSIAIASAVQAASAPKATDSLSLTRTQEQTIWQDVSQHQTSMKSPAGFTAQAGAAVPSKIKLHPLPRTVTKQVPATRPYEYAVLDNKQLLIVNPMDRKVVDIINH
jgi:hypothetical protein